MTKLQQQLNYYVYDRAAIKRHQHKKIVKFESLIFKETNKLLII